MAASDTTFPETSLAHPATSPIASILSLPKMLWVLAILLGYVWVAKTARHRRINGMLKQYGYTNREQLAKMTDQEAFEIILNVSELEFPTTFEKALQLALFRTYGIPSISKLLVETAQLSKNTNVAKRYVDTQAIAVEIYTNPPASERAINSYSRLNYLHGHYIKNGKISNDDMLYTLALFMNHPTEWINKVEWRQLTDLEGCAIGLFHKGMGDAMEIDFGKLPSASKGFQDGLQFYQELDEWAKRYEEEFMLFDENNHKTALETRALLLNTIPKRMHGPAKNVINAAMDDQLRHAVNFEDLVPLYKRLLDSLLTLRKYFLRYLALPRLKKNSLIENQANGNGRRNFRRYDALPIYVKPTLWNRWGPSACVSRLLGQPLPGDAGMMPEGFKVEECGPKVFSGKGAKEFAVAKDKLMRQRNGGCPFLITK